MLAGLSSSAERGRRVITNFYGTATIHSLPFHI